jgi:photosystem II stability/assembly factor-like uncharacterized protein
VSAAWGSTVLTGGPKGLWKSTDGGTSWKELAPDLFHPGSNSDDLSSCKWYGAHDIHIAGDTMLVAAYGPDRGLYKSLDGGGSWSRLLPDDYALEVERDRYGTLLVGSSSATNAGGVGMSGATGVRISRDSGKTWTTLNSGLSWPFGWPIATMSVGDSARWFVGSPGTGFWTAVSTDGSPVAVHSGGAAPRLALSGFRPNPARGPVAIAFSLSSAEPAILEIFDLAGRRVARREVGGMGQGSHVLALDSTFRPTPGIYTIRLVQGARSVHARSVVVR